MKKHLIISLFLSLTLLPILGFAIDAPVPKYPLPCLLSGVSSFGCPDISTLPGYVSRLYQFAVGISGIVAVAMIVIGGIYISISGSVDKKSEGKDMITSALFGLALLLGSWLILNTLNPTLVENLDIPEYPGGTLTAGTSTLSTTTICPKAQQEACDGKKN